MGYFEQDVVRDLANRIAGGLSDRVRDAVSGDVTLRAALKELQTIVEDKARSQVDIERRRDWQANELKLEKIRADWDADARSRSEYLAQIEQRRAHLHSTLLRLILRLETIVTLCGDDNLKASILDVQADIKSAIKAQQAEGVST